MKRILGIAALFVILFCATAQAATLTVTPLNDTPMILVQLGQQAILVGASDEKMAAEHLKAEGIDSLSAVVCVCDDAEHMGACDEIAASYACPVFFSPDVFFMGDAEIAWENTELTVSRGDSEYVFGAKAVETGAITFGCNGKVVEFKAKTNESAVNVRKKSTKTSDKVGRLERGDELTVLAAETNSAGEIWYLVQLIDGTQGYIRSDLLVASDGMTVVEADASSITSGVKNGEERYIGNKKTKKFHRPSCRTLPSSKNIVYLDSRDYAISKGYEPCKNCDP